MKSILALFLLLSGMAVSAQQADITVEKTKKPSVTGLENRVKQMTEELKLNSTQQAQLTALWKQQRERREAELAEFQRTGKKPAPAILKAKRTQENQAVEAEMKKILTKEQFEKWKNLSNKKHAAAQPGKQESKQ